MGLTWIELSVDSPREFVEPLSSVFLKYGHGGVAVEDIIIDGEGNKNKSKKNVRIITYLPKDETLESRINQIDVAVKLMSGLGDVSHLVQSEVDGDYWVEAWKEHFTTLHIGSNLVVHPTWREYIPKLGETIIKLDPGMAFGTGHHPTTEMCMILLEKLVCQDTKVLDIGCGSAVLSITASKLGAETVLGLDIDSVAVRVGKENVVDNKVEDSVSIQHGTLPLSNSSVVMYDVVVANISDTVILDLSSEIQKVIINGGHLIVSGLLLERYERVQTRLTSNGFEVNEMLVDGDWVALHLCKI